MRGRLINEDDPLFGVRPLSFSTFYRFSAEIEVDDLDSVLTATREEFEDSDIKDQFQDVLIEVFNEAYARHQNHLRKKDDEFRKGREHERTYVFPRYVERPMADVLSSSKFEEGADADKEWFYLDLNDEIPLTELVESLNSEREKFTYAYSSFADAGRMVKFDPTARKFLINENHDLILEFKTETNARRLLEILVTGETLLEIYLRQHGVDRNVIGSILENRNQLLGSLANEHVYRFSHIAKLLADNRDNDKELEVILVAAARGLGFVAKHVSGAGEPDGIARFNDHLGESVIILEAKSSTDIPELSALDFAGITEHKQKSAAEGCLLVAPDYPGRSKGNESAAAKRAVEGAISCWTIDNLRNLINYAEEKAITARDVLDIVLNHYTPDDVDAEIDKLLDRTSKRQGDLYSEIIGALFALQGRLPGKARTVDHLQVQVSSNDKYSRIQDIEIRDALIVMAQESKGALRFNRERDEVLLNSSLEDLTRKLEHVTGVLASPRRNGTFRDP